MLMEKGNFSRPTCRNDRNILTSQSVRSNWKKSTVRKSPRAREVSGPSNQAFQKCFDVSIVFSFLFGFSVRRPKLVPLFFSLAYWSPVVRLLVSSVLWIKYGLLRVSSYLVFVNSLGATLSLLYIVVFYFYTFNRVSITSVLLWLLVSASVTVS